MPPSTLVCTLASLAPIFAQPPAPRPATATATQVAREDAWDAAFTRTTGWTCGDIAHSIELGEGRTLWLFGDSGIGPVEDNRHVREPFSFIRNAVAWHTTPSPAGAAPSDLRFAFGPVGAEKKATSWLDPTADLWPKGTWYWLMGDG